MTGEQVIIAILLFLCIVQAIIIQFSSGREELFKLESKQQDKIIQKLEVENERLEKEIQGMEKEISISNQLAKMNNLLEAEISYNMRKGGILG